MVFKFAQQVGCSKTVKHFFYVIVHATGLAEFLIKYLLDLICIKQVY